MVIIQTTHGDTLAVTLRFPAHIAVLADIVGLDCETTISPKLPIGAETVGVSAAVAPAKLPESDLWMESGEASSQRRVCGSPGVVRVELVGGSEPELRTFYREASGV